MQRDLPHRGCASRALFLALGVAAILVPVPRLSAATAGINLGSTAQTVHGSLLTSQYGAYASYLNEFSSYTSSNGANLYAISGGSFTNALPGQSITTFVSP